MHAHDDLIALRREIGNLPICQLFDATIGLKHDRFHMETFRIVFCIL